VFFVLDVVPDCEARRAAGDTADCRASERSAYGGSDNGSSGSAYTRAD
jgi:hypothetical protein